jgi:hypothetical protein
MYLVLYVLAMIALIVGLDLTLLRHHTLPWLLVNIGIVVVFGVVYYKFLKKT